MIRSMPVREQLFVDERSPTDITCLRIALFAFFSVNEVDAAPRRPNRPSLPNRVKIPTVKSASEMYSATRDCLAKSQKAPARRAFDSLAHQQLGIRDTGQVRQSVRLRLHYRQARSFDV